MKKLHTIVFSLFVAVATATSPADADPIPLPAHQTDGVVLKDAAAKYLVFLINTHSRGECKHEPLADQDRLIAEPYVRSLVNNNPAFEKRTRREIIGVAGRDAYHELSEAGIKAAKILLASYLAEYSQRCGFSKESVPGSVSRYSAAAIRNYMKANAMETPTATINEPDIPVPTNRPGAIRPSEDTGGRTSNPAGTPTTDGKDLSSRPSEDESEDAGHSLNDRKPNTIAHSIGQWLVFLAIIGVFLYVPRPAVPPLPHW